jgi:hypothetical protein
MLPRLSGTVVLKTNVGSRSGFAPTTLVKSPKLENGFKINYSEKVNANIVEGFRIIIKN